MAHYSLTVYRWHTGKKSIIMFVVIILITVFARISAAPDKAQPSNKRHIWEKNVKISAAPK